MEERHDQEIQEAAKIAMAKVKTQNPDLTEDDLKIQLSDEVKRREAERKLRANPNGYVGPVGPVGVIPQYVPGQPGAPPMGVRRENPAFIPPVRGILRRQPPPQIIQPPPPIPIPAPPPPVVAAAAAAKAQTQRPIQRVVNMIRAKNSPQPAPAPPPPRRHRPMPPPAPYIRAPPRLAADHIDVPMAFRRHSQIIDLPPAQNTGNNIQYIQNGTRRRQ